MHKLITACLLLVILAVLQTQVFAATLNCKFKDFSQMIEGVESIELSAEHLVINSQLAIPLETSRIKCGKFGIQERLDGSEKGLQVILKSCTDDAVLEGHLIDSTKLLAAPVECN